LPGQEEAAKPASTSPSVGAPGPTVPASVPPAQPTELDGVATDLEPNFRHAYSRDQATLIRRLKRIEGQVRGIERMIERREYCIDILQQTAALRAAVDSVALLILEDHVSGCVRTAAEQGDAEHYVEEVLDVVRRTLGKPVRPRV
jgi:DNA-binding FrmR family transcriptional regulator